MYTMLVLSEKALTDHDAQRLAQLHAPDPVRAHVVVPAGTDQSTLDQLVDDVARVDLDELRDDLEGREATPIESVALATQRLTDSVELLRNQGVTADGELASDHPVARVAELAQELDVDEVVVVTEPHVLTDLLHRDWASQLRHALRDAGAERPVLHAIAGTDSIVS